MLKKKSFLATMLVAIDFASADKIDVQIQNDDQPLTQIDPKLRALESRQLTEDEDIEFLPFSVRVDNVWQTKYLYAIDQDGEIEVSDDLKSVTIQGNSKLYLANEPSISRDALFTPELIGGWLWYTADLSQTGCGCVSSIYTVLPGDDTIHDERFFSCSSSHQDKAQCPEYTIMSANQYGFAAHAHRCTTNEDGSYEDCDYEGGCSYNTNI